MNVNASALDECFLKEITKNASNQVTTSLTMTTLRLGLQIAKLIADFKLRIILTTFEGHVIERIVYSSAMGVNSKIQCVCYQHPSIFKLQQINMRNLKLEYNPDCRLNS